MSTVVKCPGEGLHAESGARPQLSPAFQLYLLGFSLSNWWGAWEVRRWGALFSDAESGPGGGRKKSVYSNTTDPHLSYQMFIDFLD